MCAFDVICTHNDFYKQFDFLPHIPSSPCKVEILFPRCNGSNCVALVCGSTESRWKILLVFYFWYNVDSYGVAGSTELKHSFKTISSQITKKWWAWTVIWWNLCFNVPAIFYQIYLMTHDTKHIFQKLAKKWNILAHNVTVSFRTFVEEFCF